LIIADAWHPRRRDGSLCIASYAAVVNGAALRSQASFLSIASTGSFLSIGSIGSALSIGSVGSFGSAFSIGSSLSLGSVMSSTSRGSVMSSGASGAILGSDRVRPRGALIGVVVAVASLLLVLQARGLPRSGAPVGRPGS